MLEFISLSEQLFFFIQNYKILYYYFIVLLYLKLLHLLTFSSDVNILTKPYFRQNIFSSSM